MPARARLVVAWLTLFVIGTDLFIVSPLLPLIAREYGVPGPAAGLSVTVFAVAYMVAAPLLGMVADRTGRRATLLTALLAFAAANALTAVSAEFAWLLISRVAAGIAAAGVTPLIYAGVGEAAYVLLQAKHRRFSVGQFVTTNPFEVRRAVMQTVRKHVHLSVFPIHQLSIEPNFFGLQ